MINKIKTTQQRITTEYLKLKSEAIQVRSSRFAAEKINGVLSSHSGDELSQKYRNQISTNPSTWHKFSNEKRNNRIFQFLFDPFPAPKHSLAKLKLKENGTKRKVANLDKSSIYMCVRNASTFVP